MPASGVTVNRVGSQTPAGPAESFTGSVRLDPLFQPSEPSRLGGASVTFEPGARTAWHTHPLGQTLIVTAGVGRVQAERGPVQEEALDGEVVRWMEQVTDAQYGATP